MVTSISLGQRDITVIFKVFLGKPSERVFMTPVIFKVFSGKPSERVSMKPVKLYSIYIQESPARGSCKVDKTFVLFRMRKICPFKDQNMSVSNYVIFAEK